MYAVIVNQQGFVVNDCVILDEDNQPLDYELKENESVVSPFITNNLGTEFIKRKWNGTEWIEGATPEEIAEWNLKHQPQPSQPSELNLLKEQVINLQAYEVEKVEKRYMEVTNV